MDNYLVLAVLALIILVLILVRALQSANVALADTLAKSETRNERLVDVLVNVMGELQIERRAATAGAREATRSSEQLGAQFVEVMVDQADVVRSFVRQVGAYNDTMLSLRPLLEQLGWLLVESHLTARGFKGADFEKILRALAKRPEDDSDLQERIEP